MAANSVFLRLPSLTGLRDKPLHLFTSALCVLEIAVKTPQAALDVCNQICAV